MTDILRQRLADRAGASGRPIAEIEQAARLPRDRFRDFLSGRKRSLTFTDVAAIAAELAVPLDWLAGQDAGVREAVSIPVHDTEDARSETEDHGNTKDGIFRKGDA